MAASAGTETAQRQEPPAAPSSGGELVGREGLIGEVTGLLQAARRSQGGAMVLRGPAGIGKSSLLAVARSAGAAAGMRVLAANGVRNESGLPFAGLHQLIRPLLGGLAELPDEQAELLRSAFGDSRAGADRFGIALATLDLLAEAAARQPVLVLADDAQWLDQPTTDVLAFVGRRLAIEPIALLACVRDGAADPFADAELPVVRVGPLSDDAARALLLASSPGLPRARQDRLLEVAQGNPLALIELPKAADGTVSPLTPLTRHVPVTAVLERAFTHRVAALPRPGPAAAARGGLR